MFVLGEVAACRCFATRRERVPKCRVCRPARVPLDVVKKSRPPRGWSAAPPPRLTAPEGLWRWGPWGLWPPAGSTRGGFWQAACGPATRARLPAQGSALLSASSTRMPIASVCCVVRCWVECGKRKRKRKTSVSRPCVGRGARVLRRRCSLGPVVGAPSGVAVA